MLPEFTREELAAALNATAMDALREAGYNSLPVDALAVAAAMGLSVALDCRQRVRGRFVRLQAASIAGGRGSILVRPEPRPERLQWTIAHEIGEALAHHVFHRLGADPLRAPSAAREAIANQLAGRLLLPSAWFQPDATHCGWDLLELKLRHATASHELIARRMLEFDVATAITLSDQGHTKFRQASRGRRAPPMAEVERRCLANVQQTAMPQVLVAGPLVVQGWPIYEEPWRREILRTVWDDADDRA